MNICTLSERATSLKLSSLRILIGIIHPNQQFFHFNDNELINRALSLEKVDQFYGQSNSILFLSLLLFVLLIFIAIALTDIGILIGFNVTNSVQVHRSNQASFGASIESEIQSNYADIGIESYFNDENEMLAEIDPNIAEDARLNTPALITKYGYTGETHHVTTEDGYILQLHRIAGGPKSPPRPGKKVCFYMHGILDSSAGIILSGPQNSALGYMLADNDYDVWLGNARGNAYSTNHTTYEPYGSHKHRKKFWSFSWHEIGYYDVPASIDYVLQKTNQTKLQYVAHSQGASAFFVMLSERPEYNDKIEMMHGMAPAVAMSHAKSSVIRAIVPFLPILQRLRALLGVYYFVMSKRLQVLAGELICKVKVGIQKICVSAFFLLFGYDSDQFNETLLPVILAHVSGIATNQLIHFGQVVNSNRFRPFDYGAIKNYIKYKQFTPPDYNLQNVKVPVALYYSENDWLVTTKGIPTLIEKLPNVVKTYLVPHKEFNHIDFLWGTDAPILIYQEILKTMKSHDSYLETTYL